MGQYGGGQKGAEGGKARVGSRNRKTRKRVKVGKNVEAKPEGKNAGKGVGENGGWVGQNDRVGEEGAVANRETGEALKKKDGGKGREEGEGMKKRWRRAN